MAVHFKSIEAQFERALCWKRLNKHLRLGALTFVNKANGVSIT